MRIHKQRRPSVSFWVVGFGRCFRFFPYHAVVAGGTNEVAAAHSIHEGGVFAVIGCSSFARFGVVGSVTIDDEVEAVAPAVATVDEVRGKRLRSFWLGGDDVGGLISKSGGLTAEHPDAFDVGKVEVGLEVGNGVVGDGTFAPVANVVGKYVGVFEVVDGNADDGGIGNRFDAGSCEILTGLDLCPEVGKGLIRTPLAREVLEICFQVVGRDGAIGGAEVVEDLQGGDVGKTHDGITEFFDVGGGDSGQDELFDVGVDDGARFELGEFVFVDAFGLGDFMGGAAEDTVNSEVGGWDRSCGGAGKCDVAGITDNEEEMAVGAGAERAVDGSGIFEDFFFEQGDEGMVGFAFDGAVEWCKLASGKGGDDFAHGVSLVGNATGERFGAAICAADEVCCFCFDSFVE